MFVDFDELQEVLGEYYDFDTITPAEAVKIDAEVEKVCKEKGITAPEGGDEEYYKICDGVIGRVFAERIDEDYRAKLTAEVKELGDTLVKLGNSGGREVGFEWEKVCDKMFDELMDFARSKGIKYE